MLRKIESYIRQHRLPLPPKRLIVALSGGADSVALLLLMQELGYSIVAAHCNFHLRGEESDRDETFVRQLCREKSIPLAIQHFDTSAFAQAQGISIEMAARQLRYEWFEDIRKQEKAYAIAVAHHSDDNAETLLLNLTRGTGLHGLKGMLPKNGYIIRPLLGIRRKELELYLQQKQQTFVTDSTNLQSVYKRNRIRLEILPLLQEINPAIYDCLSLTARHLAEAEQLYQMSIEHLQKSFMTQQSEGWDISIARLLEQPASATLLHETLIPFGFKPAEIEMIYRNLHQQTGAIFQNRTYIATLHRNQLCIRKHPQQFDELPIPNNGICHLPNGMQLHLQRLARTELTEIPKSRNTIAIDAEKIVGMLQCRSTRNGDRFQPFGMKGSQLVSNYLTNQHRSVIDKKAAVVLCDQNGILWLINERPDQRAAITANTQEVLLIRCERQR